MTGLRSPARKASGFTLLELVVVVAIIGVLMALLLSAIQGIREAAYRSTCANNVKQLSLGLHGYHDSTRSFPPAAVTSPYLHGWGAYVLSYIERSDLSKKYNWQEHWYAPANQVVVTTQLPIMNCPATPISERMNTGTTGGDSWSAAAGDYSTFRRLSLDIVDEGYAATPKDPAGVLRLNKTTRLENIKDGTSNTLLLVEIAGRPNLWQMGKMVSGNKVTGAGWGQSGNSGILYGYDPDLDAKPGPCAINCTNDHEIYSFHRGGATVSMADGSVRFLHVGLSISTLAALVTQNGGEQVGDDAY